VKGKQHTIHKYKIPSLVENANGITIQKIQIPVLITQLIKELQNQCQE
jgi:hypothetical protein